MPIEHPPPTPATAKYLYAHAFRCAFEGCTRPLYKVDEHSGHRILNSTICHINARRENGPRWDGNQSAEDNRSAENLVLMCIEHSATIDDPKTATSYKPSLLREWKARQLDEYDRLQQGWGLDDTMAREALDQSSAPHVNITNSVVHLGGTGGMAPGAGGGGGGAIGPGARAGDGGGGGEMITALIDLTDSEGVPASGMRINVGKGGSANTMPGQHSLPGEDSSIELLSAEGKVIRTIRAKGGARARSPASYPPDGAVEICEADIIGGFRIVSLMPVNAAEFRDGLLYALGCGWETFTLPKLPCDAAWRIAGRAVWDAPLTSLPASLFMSLHNPNGDEVACIALTIGDENPGGRSWQWLTTIGTSFDQQGLWALRVTAAGYLLAELGINVAIRP